MLIGDTQEVPFMPSGAIAKGRGERQTLSTRHRIAPIRVYRCWRERSCAPICCTHLQDPGDANTSKVHRGQNVGVSTLPFAAASVDFICDLMNPAPCFIERLQVPGLG